jgi:hypothetical protein
MRFRLLFCAVWLLAGIIPVLAQQSERGAILRVPLPLGSVTDTIVAGAHKKQLVSFFKEWEEAFRSGSWTGPGGICYRRESDEYRSAKGTADATR